MLRSLSTFYALPGVRRRILFKAALLVAITRLALWLLPFRSVERLVSWLAKYVMSTRQDITSEDISWAISVAAAYIPRATCLTQALAARPALWQLGFPAELRIGVARGEYGQLEAHAWLESRGKVIVGGSQQTVARFQELLNLEDDTA